MKKDSVVIRAERNGIQRGFYAWHWALLPAHKYGWKEIQMAAVPAPVAQAIDQVAAKPQPAPATPLPEAKPAKQKRAKRKSRL